MLINFQTFLARGVLTSNYRITVEFLIACQIALKDIPYWSARYHIRSKSWTCGDSSVDNEIVILHPTPFILLKESIQNTLSCYYRQLFYSQTLKRMFTGTALDSSIKYISINSAGRNFFSKCNSKDISQETKRREKYNLIKNILFFCKNHKLMTFS